jgi:RsiW-degrading membrane proteinase PrsW (M82 family)
MMRLFLLILLVLHFAYHLVASFGGVWTFYHSYKHHKKNLWKLVAAIFWLAISVLLLVVSDDALHACH